VALKILEVIQRDKLADNARIQGEFLKEGLARLAGKFPQVLGFVRGLGLMVGFELTTTIPAFASNEKTASLQFVHRLHEAGLLAIPAGAQVIRLLPPLNLRRQEAEEGLAIIEAVARTLSSGIQ